MDCEAHMRRRFLIWGFAMTVAVVSYGEELAMQPPLRGINLSHWFSQYSLPEHPSKPVSTEDMKLIRKLGLDHIRLLVDPARLWDFSGHGPLNSKFLQQVDAAIQLALDHDLNVIVDMHPRPDFKKRLESEPGFYRSFLTCWEELAAHLAQHDSRRLALEILNEPTIKNPRHWQTMVNELHAVIRAAAPEHTIVIGGGEWSGIEPLCELVPVEDSNTFYTFHFYDPHIFTHQGAIWGNAEWPFLKHIPYPLSCEKGKTLLTDISNKPARKALKAHIAQNWNAEKLQEHIATAAAWATEHGVTIWCGEFGVYQTYSDPTDRARYLTDIRTTFENHGIGWAMWDYQGSFSLVEKQAPGSPAAVDRAVTYALGLSTKE
jgi:endoglucanase